MLLIVPFSDGPLVAVLPPQGFPERPDTWRDVIARRGDCPRLGYCFLEEVKPTLACPEGLAAASAISWVHMITLEPHNDRLEVLAAFWCALAGLGELEREG